MGIDFIIFYIIIFIFGTVFGSFSCCQAWRIHEAKNGKKLGKRSVCINCKHKLAWYDNLPLISWLLLRGKCRYCKEKIGKAEILSEFGLGLIFFAIIFKYSCAFPSVSAFFSADFLSFLIHPIILLIALIPFWILLVYDAKWGELPVFIILLTILLAIIYQFFNHGNWLQIGIATGILAGIYYLLYFFSKEKLVGGGDWILCVSIAIFLGRWELVIIELFLSNLFASFSGIPQILKKERKPIPFGPFLIISLFLILLFSDQILQFFIIY